MYLLQKRVELDNDKTTTVDLVQVENQAIDNIVKMQREVGVKSVTDGEFRRSVASYFYIVLAEHLPLCRSA